MYLKQLSLALAIVQAAGMANAAQEYWKSFSSNVDPLNITIPSIPQTTSYNENTECTWYDPSSFFKYDPKEWPTSWDVATSNGINKSAEFTALYNSIDWKSAPNIPVRKAVNGALDMTGYDSSKDPDCWWSASMCTKPKHPNINEDIYECPEPETWGLTYDDGPNCSHNAFYDYLEQQKLKATMFYIGSNVLNWPYGAQRGIKDGHHIAQHTWSHGLMTTLTNEEVLAELYYTQKIIKAITGVTPRYWRPAFGDVDDRVRWIATQLNLTTILWNLDTDDWAAGVSEPMSTIQKNYEDFIQMGTNGTFKNSGNIVLSHEINNTTMQLAVDYIPKIKKAYKNVVDVATCMNITYPYMEKTISFKGFGGNSSTSNASSSSSSSAKASGTAAGSSSSSSSSPSGQAVADNATANTQSGAAAHAPAIVFATAAAGLAAHLLL